jgi:hypothetical protein
MPCWWRRTFPSQAATTVYGLTPRRLWATVVAVVALAGAVIGGLGLVIPYRILPAAVQAVKQVATSRLKLFNNLA